jgi:CMP-N,N'-diacetyllegionaminic acid synthase
MAKINTENLLCTLCMRTGSKGLKNKNFLKLLGKPLYQHTLDQVNILKNKISKVIISTDSVNLFKKQDELGVDMVLHRDPGLASDHAGKIDVIRDALIKAEEYFDTEFELIMDLDVTSPLRRQASILKAIEIMQEGSYSNLISGAESRKNPYFNMIELKENIPKLAIQGNFVRRQDAPEIFDMNASIYLWKRDTLLKESTLFLDKTFFLKMPQDESIDIDSQFDFTLVEAIMLNRND